MEDDFQFEWGKKGGVGDEGGAHSQYYESFTLNGKEYSLYDCVHFYKTGETETDIGKLVKIYETEAHVKMIRVIWFFRPNEIRNFLGVYEPRWNEIFLGSGQGVGLSNVNHLEAIIGKCTVVCTLKDPKNPQPSEAELQRASYIYSRTFDVGKCKLLEKFPNEIQGVPVECLFNKSVECFGNNRNDDQKPLRLPDFRKNLGGPVGQSNVSSKLGSKKNMASPANNAKSSSRMNPVVRELKKPMVCAGLRGNASKGILKHKLVLDGNGTQSTSITHGHFKEKRKVQFVDQPPMTASAIPHKKKKVPDGVAFTKQETSEKTPDDRSHWFKNKMELTWEQKLRSAQETGHLILLENLDPSYASSDVEGLVSQALNQKVEAKMIQQNAFSAPHHGKAFVVFESKVAADKAISDLERKCLVLDDQRCVIGSRKTLKAPDRAPRFVGHLSISKIRHQNQHEDMRKAVSTSHSAQPNTFEYDLAMGWRLQELRSNRYWEALYKEQVEEINQVRRAKSEL